MAAAVAAAPAAAAAAAAEAAAAAASEAEADAEAEVPSGPPGSLAQLRSPHAFAERSVFGPTSYATARSAACVETDEDGVVWHLDAPGGERLQPGWRRVEDLEGNVWFQHDESGERVAALVVSEEAGDDDGGGGAAGATADARGGACEEVDADGTVWQLDAPGGRRLQRGWRRCEDATDVWYENDATHESRWDAPLA